MKVAVDPLGVHCPGTDGETAGIGTPLGSGCRKVTTIGVVPVSVAGETERTFGSFAAASDPGELPPDVGDDPPLQPAIARTADSASPARRRDRTPCIARLPHPV